MNIVMTEVKYPAQILYLAPWKIKAKFENKGPLPQVARVKVEMTYPEAWELKPTVTDTPVSLVFGGISAQMGLPMATPTVDIQMPKVPVAKEGTVHVKVTARAGITGIGANLLQNIYKVSEVEFDIAVSETPPIMPPGEELTEVPERRILEAPGGITIGTAGLMGSSGFIGTLMKRLRGEPSG